MEKKPMQPVEDRGKSADQMAREGGQREADASRDFMDAVYKREGNRDMARAKAGRKMRR
jgi:hypothetical protein